MMLSHLDDPAPFIPDDEFRRQMIDRSRRLHRRWFVARSLVVLATIMGGAAIYAQVRDATRERTEVNTDPSSDQGAGSLFDDHARSVCPDEISSHRLSGGRLVAAFDTTFGQVRDEFEPVGDPAPDLDGPAVVCWYEDATFTPALGGDPEVTDAASAYFHGQLYEVRTVDGPPTRPNVERAAADDHCVVPEPAPTKADVGRAAAEQCFGGRLPTASRLPAGWELNFYYVDLVEPLADGVVRIEQVYSPIGEGPTEAAFISLWTTRQDFDDVMPILLEDGYQPEGGYMVKATERRLTLAWGSDTTTFRLVSSGVDRASLTAMANSVLNGTDS